MSSEQSGAVNSYFGTEKSKIYDQQIRQSIPGYEAIHAMTYALLSNALPVDAHILVAGAGTGMELISMGKQQPTWQFTAFDISPEMLSMCASNLRAAGVDKNVALVHGSAIDIPQKKHFDAATSLLVSHFIQDPTARLAYYTALCSCCKPGALLLIADLVGDKNHPSFELFGKAWRTYNLNNGRDEAELDDNFKKSSEVVSFLPEEVYCDMLEKAGFEVVKEFYRGFLFCGWVCRVGG